MQGTDTTKEQLVARIAELELLCGALLDEREKEDRLDFSWAGNLGHWYWNIKTNTVTFNPLKITNLGYTKEDIPAHVPFQFFTSRLHPEDYDHTMAVMRAHLRGETDVYEVEYRIRTKEGGYKWYYDRGKITRYDEEGKPVFLAGIVFDVTEEKQRQAAILARAAQDPLTQLYTKEKAVYEMKKRLLAKQPGTPCGLLLLDIDHFSAVNAAKGQIFGDTVLQKIGDIFLSNAGDGIVARVGGDEFLLFAPETSENAFRRQVAQIREKIRKLYIGDDPNHCLLPSMGLTISNDEDCELLFINASAALYHAKQLRSGALAIYETLPTHSQNSENMAEESTSRIISSDNWEEENLLSFAFRTIDYMTDLKSTLHVLFSRAARQYHLDELLVMTTNPESQTSDTLYLWTINDAFLPVPGRMHLDRPTYESLSAWLASGSPKILTEADLSQWDKDARLYFHDGTLRAQLLCPVYNHGIFCGCIVFGTKKAAAHFDNAAVRALHEFSNIVYAAIRRVNAESTSRAKTEFLSRMSHEIRTPVSAIVGMIEIIKHSMSDTGRVAYCLSKIDNASHYLLSLISNVLEMSKIESGELHLNEEPFSLQDAVKATTGLIRGVVGEKQQFHCRMEITQDGIIGDIVSLQQVLTNLLVNAVKFTSAEGQIELTIQETGKTSAGKFQYRFSVRDNGIGIAKRDLQRIFERFEQVSEPQANAALGLRGAGLGLAICDKLVRTMGGQIEVESALGKGSCFSFTLAFLPADSASLPQKAAPEDKALSGMTILVVEDNEWNAEVERDLLELQGARVLLAHNGKEGIETFTASAPGEIDAILMDIRMPVMDGIEAAARIRRLPRADADLPIIAVTANTFDTDGQRSLENGMNAHVTKPVDSGRLTSIVSSFLQKRS